MPSKPLSDIASRSSPKQRLPRLDPRRYVASLTRRRCHGRSAALAVGGFVVSGEARELRVRGLGFRGLVRGSGIRGSGSRGFGILWYGGPGVRGLAVHVFQTWFAVLCRAGRHPVATLP